MFGNPPTLCRQAGGPALPLCSGRLCFVRWGGGLFDVGSASKVRKELQNQWVVEKCRLEGTAGEYPTVSGVGTFSTE